MANVQTNEDMLHSRQVAEAAREAEWKGAGFLRELFLGKFRLDLIHPYPLARVRAPRVREVLRRDGALPPGEGRPGEDRRDRRVPADVIDGLRKLGAFGMKIPLEYGGLGLNQVEYGKVMQLVGSYDANITALLSAHQSIGVPQPLKLFGTEEQKKKYLPRIAKGAISAFALTEANVGSDPGAPRDDRGADRRRQALRPQRRRSSGARTAPSPS